jgi:hypothetical protein
VNERNREDLPVLSVTQDQGVVFRNDLAIDIKYDESTLSSYKVIHPGDFVISLRSFQGGFELSNVLGISSPAYTIFDFAVPEEQDKLYWKTIFKTFKFIESLKTVTFGIRDGKSISFKEFGDLKLNYPSNVDEQRRIGEFFAKLDETIAANQRNYRKEFAMNGLNLISFLRAARLLDEEGLIAWLTYANLSNMKPREIDTLEKLIENLSELNLPIDSFSDFVVGYEVPQMSKEFDLIKVSKDFVVDIELKYERPKGDKLKKQQDENSHYLRVAFPEKTIVVVTYIAAEDLFVRGEKVIEKSTIGDLIKIPGVYENFSDRFNPKKFLVSPYNDVKKFVNGEYLLTNQQQEVQNSILGYFQSTKGGFMAVKGEAGTGKTLLALRIMQLMFNADNLSVCYVFPGHLNNGLIQLENHGFPVMGTQTFIKDFEKIKVEVKPGDVFIFEEAQRLRTNVTQKIDELVQLGANILVFYDPLQQLSIYEVRDDTLNWIGDHAIEKRTLTTKIRTNREIATFVGHFFDLSKRWDYTANNAVDFEFAESIDEAKLFIESLELKGAKYINLTPTKYGAVLPSDSMKIEGSETAHSVLGQEFDHVCVIVDQSYGYDESGKLMVRGYPSSTPYNPLNMLRQNMTRARYKLTVVFVESSELVKRVFN